MKLEARRNEGERERKGELRGKTRGGKGLPGAPFIEEGGGGVRRQDGATEFHGSAAWAQSRQVREGMGAGRRGDKRGNEHNGGDII